MFIQCFEQNDVIKNKGSYIEAALQTYIKETRYPRKLVLENIQNDIKKRKELETKWKKQIASMTKELDSMNETKESLRIKNTKKISALLNNFSDNIF